MTYGSFPYTPGSGRSGAVDQIGGVDFPRQKLTHGAEGTATDVSATAPLPVREPVKGNALNKGGITSSGASQAVAAANSNRTVIEISNGGSTGVWLAFGSAAAVGQGTYLPAKATGYWPTTAQVTCINEASGSNGPIGFTEW